eukprot:c28753_g2_i1 orf=783-2702(-)
MQPASMLGVGHVQGIWTGPLVNNSQIGAEVCFLKGGYQHQTSHQLSLPQEAILNQPKMDDFLEQMFSLPSWSEIGGNTRAPWDFNVGGLSNSISIDAGSGLSSPQKLFTMSLMPAAIVGSPSAVQGLSDQNCEAQDNINHPQTNENILHSFEAQLIAHQLQHRRGFQDALVGSAVASSAVQPHIGGRLQVVSQGGQEAAQKPLQRIVDGAANEASVTFRLNAGNSTVTNLPASQVQPSQGPRLTRSTSLGSSGSEGSASQQHPPDSQSPSAVAPTWRQSYRGRVLSLPIVGQTNADDLFPHEGTLNDLHLLGKRPRDDEEVQAGPQDGFFTSFGGAQICPVQTTRSANHLPHNQIQASQGISMLPYGSHTGLAQPQGAGVVTGTPRPRVRARRGQATDPHSIAERLRRERIAERMKALQELVPNSNKTDKASMLDEIIEYVKFLQLQVKVLSMSRLGGAGAVAPLVAELPTEGHGKSSASSLGHNTGVSIPAQDGMAAAERQVARLMEEDMGSAMQYLQGKGLCLMPISLATVISSSSPRRRTNDQCGIQSLTAYEHSRLEASSCITVTSSSNNIASGVVASPVNTSGDVVCIDSVALGGNMIRNSKDSIQLAAVDKNLLSSTTNNGAKWNEEPTGQVQ